MEGQEQWEEGLQSGRPGLVLEMVVELKKKKKKSRRIGDSPLTADSFSWSLVRIKSLRSLSI